MEIIGMSDALVEFRNGLTTVPKTEYPLILLIDVAQYNKAYQLGQGDVMLGISMAIDKIPA
jgi:hypothetical protein